MGMYGPRPPRKLRGEKRVRRQFCTFPERVGSAGVREGAYRICWNCGWRPNKDRDSLGEGFGVNSVAFSNVLTGGTATASTEDGSNTADKAVDGSTTTYWLATTTPAYWDYDLGSGNTAIVSKLTIRPYYSSYAAVKNWELLGSMDGSDYRIIDTGQCDDETGSQTFDILNGWPNRYYRLNIVNTWDSGLNPGIYELSLVGGDYYPDVSSGCPFCGSRNYA